MRVKWNHAAGAETTLNPQERHLYALKSQNERFSSRNMRWQGLPRGAKQPTCDQEARCGLDRAQGGPRRRLSRHAARVPESTFLPR